MISELSVIAIASPVEGSVTTATAEVTTDDPYAYLHSWSDTDDIYVYPWENNNDGFVPVGTSYNTLGATATKYDDTIERFSAFMEVCHQKLRLSIKSDKLIDSWKCHTKVHSAI